LWEAANGHGGIVGIQILLNTRGENVETIEFGLFERTERELGDLPFNYFAPQGRGGEIAVLEQMAGKDPATVPEHYRPVIRWTTQQLRPEVRGVIGSLA
jgi:hypothetical protein